MWEGLIPAGWTTHPLVLIPGVQPSPHMVLLHSGPVSFDALFSRQKQQTAGMWLLQQRLWTQVTDQ